MSEEMQKYYFTFGSEHAHPNGYYVIEAPGEQFARAKMCSMFGPKWSFCYKSKEAAGVDKWGLKLAGLATVDTQGSDEEEIVFLANLAHRCLEKGVES